MDALSAGSLGRRDSPNHNHGQSALWHPSRDRRVSTISDCCRIWRGVVVGGGRLAQCNTCGPFGSAGRAETCESRCNQTSSHISNPLAGPDPSKVFVGGCDLDCGQDVLRLSQELKARNISHPYVAMWTSVDVTKSGLPEFTVAEPFEPVSGWLAISMRSLRMGDVFHETYPPGAFACLSNCRPAAYETIWLYYIPPESTKQNSPTASDAMSLNRLATK